MLDNVCFVRAWYQALGLYWGQSCYCTIWFLWISGTFLKQLLPWILIVTGTLFWCNVQITYRLAGETKLKHIRQWLHNMPEKVNFRDFMVEAKNELVFGRIKWVCINRSQKGMWLGGIPPSGSVGVKYIISQSVTLCWNFDSLNILRHWYLSAELCDPGQVS